MGKPFESIAIPPRLALRPRDGRGYPIPFTVLLDRDGTPDFRVTDRIKWDQVLDQRLCALCAEPLGRHLAFVGGPLSHESRYFTDPPMHLECARYAVQVCPFLAAPNFRYAESVLEKDGVLLRTAEHVDPARPDRFFIATSRSMRRVRLSTGGLLIQAGPWDAVEWWLNGQPIDLQAA